MDVDVASCLVFTVPGAPTLDSVHGWAPGPLPLEIPAPASAALQAGTARVTDTAARSSHVAARVRETLYGSGRRWHHFVSEFANERCEIDAWEVLACGADMHLLIAHVQLAPEDPVHTLAALAARRSDLRTWLASSLPAPLVLPGGERPRIVSHLRWRGAVMPEPVDASTTGGALVEWSPAQRWAWFLASGTAPESVLPDTTDSDLADGVVSLSRDWRATVLRDGVAYVALTRRVDDEPAFHDLARVLVRSVHLDALLLGIVQLRALHAFADRTSKVMDGALSAIALEELEGDLLRLRTRVWWNDVADQGGQTSEVLAAFQRQHRLPQLYAQVVSDLTDATRFVQAHHARERDERERAATSLQRRREGTITLVTFVLFPLTVVFSAAQLWADTDGKSLATATGVGLIFGLASFLAVGPRHRLIRSARRRRN